MTHRIAAYLCALGALFAGAAYAAPAAGLDNAGCLTCHDATAKTLKVLAADGERDLRAVDPDKYGKAVHAKMQGVDCHLEIIDSVAPHKQGAVPKVAECSRCHEDLAKKAMAAGQALPPGLDKVQQNIAAYRNSFHVRPNKDDKTRVNATCNDCHDTHSFFGSA